MILRVSDAFRTRFKCQLSLEGARPPQERRLDAWSCHFVRIGTMPLVVAMNDATLSTLILPAKGVKGFADLWLGLLWRIAEMWKKHGAHFDPNNQTVILLPRTDRSLIGSMNDAVHMLRLHHELSKDGGRELDLSDMEQELNDTPYSALGYGHPDALLSKMLGRE